MAKAGKRIRKVREGIDREKLYPLADAVKMVKERAVAKFDETIEVALNLGVDPRHADQMVRGVANLPNGSGRIGARGGLRPRRSGRGGEEGGRRHRRGGGSGGDGAEGRDQFRPLHRDARHDAARRPARKDPRARAA